MAKPAKSKTRIEFGDFQTPAPLARSVCRILSSQGISPASIVEPTCGRGSFLFAALNQFPETLTVASLKVVLNRMRYTLVGLTDQLATAELQRKRVQTAQLLLKQTDGFDESVIRFDEIIIVKTMAGDSKRLFIEAMSTDVAQQLDANPALLKKPKALVDILGLPSPNPTASKQKTRKSKDS